MIHGTGGDTGGGGKKGQGKDYVRVGKGRWFRGRPKATTTSDNYLPRRRSVLINSGVSFNAMLPYLICDYGLSSVYTITLNPRTMREKIRTYKHLRREAFFCG